MKVLDPGHKYLLDSLDGEAEVVTTFVKREGAGYPGNVGHYPGTTLQESLRADIDRVKYLDRQAPHPINQDLLFHMRACIDLLERRAAERHGREYRKLLLDGKLPIEYLPVCSKCGHIGCEGECKR